MKHEKVETRLDMLEKEIKVAGEDLDKLRMDLAGEVEDLKIEVTAIKRLMELRHPEIAEEFRKVRAEVMEELGTSGKKQAA